MVKHKDGGNEAKLSNTDGIGEDFAERKWKPAEDKIIVRGLGKSIDIEMQVKCSNVKGITCKCLGA